MFNLRRIETIALPDKVENAYSMDISQTGHISITTSVFIVIYQITPNKQNTGKGLSCRKYIIPSPQYTLKDVLGINIKDFLYELPQEEYYKCILTVDLTPDLDIVQPYTPKFIRSFWSPPRCDKNYDCALATLSNNGIVEVYVKVYSNSYNSDFIRVCNVTEKYAEILKDTWGNIKDESCVEKLKHLTIRANELKVKCVTWGSCMSDGYHILILGHLSAKISFWKVSSQTESLELAVDYLCSYQTDLDQITSLTWKKVSDGVLLFIGDRDGRVLTLTLIVSSKGLHVEKGCFLLTERDDLKVHSIHVMNTQAGYFIILVKTTTLIIIPCDKLDESCEFACNNIEILDITIVENHILILTKTGVIKEVVLNITSSGIDLKWRHFYIDMNTYMKYPIRVVTSKNKMLLFILARRCKPKQSKVDYWNVDLHVFANNESRCLEYLLNSPSKQLTYKWDYLEVYRCVALQTKNLLLENIQFEKHYDKYDFYTLKVLLYVSRVCESLSDQLKDAPSIKPFDDMVAILYLKMVVARMLHLLELYRKNGTLTTSYYKNLLILSNYIQQVAAEDMANVLDLSDLMMDTIIDITQKVKSINFTENMLEHCFACGENLYDITCMPPHFDSRCAISLRQIKGIVKYKCVLCDSVAHEEIAREVKVVVCPFCDIPMVKRSENVCVKKEIEITYSL